MWRKGLALLLVLGAALAAAPAQAATAVDRAVAYLERAQSRDGGFGGAPGSASAPTTTAWAAYALAAAGRDAGSLRRPGGATLADAVVASIPGVRTTGDVERTVMALRTVGRDVPADLERELLERRAADGSFEGQTTLTSFGVFALRAAGHGPRDPLVAGSAAFVAAQQNDDGGFSFARRGGRSGIDDTAAAIEALVAAGRGPRSGVVRRAVRFLEARQRPDGGFPLMPGGTSNAQSTAWAVQALTAAGRDVRRLHRRGARSPLAYLRSLQAADGSIRYSRTSVQTPVWVTAPAVCALLGVPLPILP
ncbi:MAG TPA: prenyltransferase/squalene oxidase repeat-containing protein [Capillimicrobium sp.]|nr:prenyltransferase/squalene oxidase repeat-containing protein [Capillimicrobium sp.]